MGYPVLVAGEGEEVAGLRRRRDGGALVLCARDCLAFGPPADTTFVNESARTCIYLVILARS